MSETASKPQGWTGKKCPACKGCGERYSEHLDRDAACPSCGGTGDEYGDIEVTDDAAVMRLWRECGLPEYFLGNGGTNHKLVEFALRCAELPSARRASDV